MRSLDPDSQSGSGSRRAKWPRKKKKISRAQGFSCSLDVLYWGIELQFSIKKRYTNIFSCVFKFFVIKTQDPDPDPNRIRIHLKCWIRIHNTRWLSDLFAPCSNSSLISANLSKWALICALFLCWASSSAFSTCFLNLQILLPSFINVNFQDTYHTVPNLPVLAPLFLYPPINDPGYLNTVPNAYR